MGLYLIAERILSFGKPLVAPDRKPIWRQALAMVTVFLLAVVLLPFALMNLSTVGQFFLSLFTNTQWELPDSRAFIVIVPAVWIDFVQQRRKNEMIFLSWPLFSRAFLLALAFLSIFLF